MGLPAFLVRKLYKRGSLRETSADAFAFAIHNPLGKATLVAPPQFTINGVRYHPKDVDAGSLDLAAIAMTHPCPINKGDRIDLVFHGRLLRGANRIHLRVMTKEFGELELFVEEQEANYCDLPYGEEE